MLLYCAVHKVRLYSWLRAFFAGLGRFVIASIMVCFTHFKLVIDNWLFSLKHFVHLCSYKTEAKPYSCCYFYFIYYLCFLCSYYLTIELCCCASVNCRATFFIWQAGIVDEYRNGDGFSISFFGKTFCCLFPCLVIFYHSILLL